MNTTFLVDFDDDISFHRHASTCKSSARGRLVVVVSGHQWYTIPICRVILSDVLLLMVILTNQLFRVSVDNRVKQIVWAVDLFGNVWRLGLFCPSVFFLIGRAVIVVILVVA
jgi:hypothetical protein